MFSFVPYSRRMDVPEPTSEAEIEHVLRSTAAGPPSFGDDTPWDFALRWSPSFVLASVWRVVSRLLLDPDPTIRTRALEFANAWTAGAGMTVPRLLEIARKQAGAYPEPELRVELSRTLANLAVTVRSFRAKIAAAIASLLGGAPPPRGMTALLAEYEPDAVIANAGAWTDDDEDQAAAEGTASAMAMYRRDHVLALMRALAGRSAAFREEVAKAVSGPLAIPDDKLRLILENDGLPLPATTPTIDECRGALGL
jgi:hypothetical protein